MNIGPEPVHQLSIPGTVPVTVLEVRIHFDQQGWSAVTTFAGTPSGECVEITAQPWRGAGAAEATLDHAITELRRLFFDHAPTF